MFGLVRVMVIADVPLMPIWLGEKVLATDGAPRRATVTCALAAEAIAALVLVIVLVVLV